MRFLFGVMVGVLIGWCVFGNGTSVIKEYSKKDISFKVDGETYEFQPPRIVPK